MGGLGEVRHLPARLCGMGLLPGDIVRERLRRLRSPLHWVDASLPLVNFAVLLTLFVGIGSQYVPKAIPMRAQEVFSRLSVYAQGVVLAAVLLAITTLGPPGVAPFIYFRF